MGTRHGQAHGGAQNIDDVIDLGLEIHRFLHFTNFFGIVEYGGRDRF